MRPESADWDCPNNGLLVFPFVLMMLPSNGAPPLFKSTKFVLLKILNKSPRNSKRAFSPNIGSFGSPNDFCIAISTLKKPGPVNTLRPTEGAGGMPMEENVGTVRYASAPFGKFSLACLNVLLL